MTQMIIRICRSTAEQLDTSRMTPTTSSPFRMGADTAMIRSPVVGLLPIKEATAWVSMAAWISEVPGRLPEMA